MSIADSKTSDGFSKAMVEKHSQQTKAFAEIPDMATELRQAQKQFVKSAQGMLNMVYKM